MEQHLSEEPSVALEGGSRKESSMIKTQLPATLLPTLRSVPLPEWLVQR
jgi:hypothetical protein